MNQIASILGLPLHPSDLAGRPAISYERFSSPPQERGSSLDRQDETRDRVVAYYKLRLDQTIIDRALSASKGHHRKRGNLADLLDAVNRGAVERGTVLIVESMDRLFREGLLDVMPILSQIIYGGMVLVTGDLTIWDAAAINGPANHKLVSEINAAREYTKRIAEFASGAHRRRRQRLSILADDPNATRPVLNGCRPGWIVRDESGECVLHPTHAAAVQRIFLLCKAGLSVRQIAEILNRECVPTIPWSGRAAPHWRAGRIGAILRDRYVMGLFTPHRREGNRRVKAGREVLLFPNAVAVQPELFYAARDVLKGRRALVGRRGKDIPNLFTRHVICQTCGGTMRVDTGGGIRRGQRRRTFVCAAWVEGKACNDRTRYDLHWFEPKILRALLELTDIAPRDHGAGINGLLAEIANLRAQADELKGAIAALARQAGRSSAIAQQVEAIGREIDDNESREAALREQLILVESRASRAVEQQRFLRTAIKPALAGDLDARERLRSLLVKTHYRVIGGLDGRLIVEASGQSVDLSPAWLGDGPHPDEDTSHMARWSEDVRFIDGPMRQD